MRGIRVDNVPMICKVPRTGPARSYGVIYTGAFFNVSFLLVARGASRLNQSNSGSIKRTENGRQIYLTKEPRNAHSRFPAVRRTVVVPGGQHYNEQY